mgnify:CR=1 FL=1
MELKGKAAVITGGGTGVGRATALSLAKLGCSVLVNYSRSQKEAEETAAEAAKFGVKTIAYKADVSVDAECRAMIKKAADDFGRLDILVNNAGTTRLVPHHELDSVTDEDWERILMVNLKGPFQCSRAAKEALDASGDGIIINIASIAGIKAVGTSIPYCNSKAGLINQTIALARVLGPTIRVNCIAPGFIDGEWLKKSLGKDYDAIKQIAEGSAPLGKVCKPEDVADAILSLITGSKLITGQIIAVEGGMLLS